jgi:hypothetical protein
VALERGLRDGLGVGVVDAGGAADQVDDGTERARATRGVGLAFAPDRPSCDAAPKLAQQAGLADAGITDELDSLAVSRGGGPGVLRTSGVRNEECER